MNILFTICGRAGSKGIKNKNIKKFLGYELPFYTLSAMELYKKEHPEHSCDIVLNTDSEELIRLLQNQSSLPIEVVKREESLGLDNTPKIAVILNCLKEVTNRNNKTYDCVVDLDITAPLRTVDDIHRLIEKKNATKVDLVFSVTDARRNPYFNMVKKGEKGYVRVIESSFHTRQEAPEIFDMNASMYAYSPDFLMSEKGIFDGTCDIIKMQDTAVLDLDHENDFELMQVIANYLFEKDEAFGRIRDNCVKFQ